MANLILSAFADEYSDRFDEQLEVLNELNIGYIELRHADGKNISLLERADVGGMKEKLNDHGVKVSAVGSPVGKIVIGRGMQEHYKLARRVFEYTALLGAKYCRIFSFYLPEGETRESCRGQVFDALEILLRMAEEYGVTLCHENEALIYGESPSACLELMNYFGSRLKCTFDMGNFVLDGYRPYPDAYKLLFGHIEYFHIKDALSAGAVVPAGKGEACIKEILDDYVINGRHDAFITLEPHLQTFAGLNALVGKSFDNPYKYRDSKQAFYDAFHQLEELL